MIRFPKALSITGVTWGAVWTIVTVCLMPSAFSDEHPAAAHAAHESARPAPAAEGPAGKPSLVEPLHVLWNGFTSKLRELAAADQLNEELHARVAELEILNQRLAFETMSRREETRAAAAARENKEEGGTAAARTLASIEPADPQLLSKPPKAIFQASADAFAKGDYETAATGFVFLANNKENAAYHRPQVFFLAGISLYKLSNYKTARKYFEQAAAGASALGEQSDDLAYAPRAMSWLALAHEKLGDKKQEQAVIQELIQKYPKSAEARRLNGSL